MAKRLVVARCGQRGDISCLAWGTRRNADHNRPLTVAARTYVDGPVRGVPAGLTRLPEPGEVLVSPALERVLDGPRRSEVAPRLPGRVVGTIGDEGLTGPDQLMAWAVRRTA